MGDGGRPRNGAQALPVHRKHIAGVHAAGEGSRIVVSPKWLKLYLNGHAFGGYGLCHEIDLKVSVKFNKILLS
jgi:hypothetical protein